MFEGKNPSHVFMNLTLVFIINIFFGLKKLHALEVKLMLAYFIKHYEPYVMLSLSSIDIFVTVLFRFNKIFYL